MPHNKKPRKPHEDWLFRDLKVNLLPTEFCFDNIFYSANFLYIVDAFPNIPHIGLFDYLLYCIYSCTSQSLIILDTTAFIEKFYLICAV